MFSACVLKGKLYYSYTDLSTLMDYVSYKEGRPIALECDQCRAYGGMGNYTVIGNKFILENLEAIKKLLPKKDLPIKFVEGADTAINTKITSTQLVWIQEDSYDFDPIMSASLK